MTFYAITTSPSKIRKEWFVCVCVWFTVARDGVVHHGWEGMATGA